MAQITFFLDGESNFGCISMDLFALGSLDLGHSSGGEMEHHAAIDISYQRDLVALVATWVLLAVFVCSAIAFVLVIFKVYEPGRQVRTFLFGVFAISTVGTVAGAAANLLKPDPAPVIVSFEREKAAEQSRQSPPESKDRKITVFAQISSPDETRKFNAMKNTLPAARFIVPGVDIASSPIPKNQVRYCNDGNKKDAVEVQEILQKNGFQPFDVIKIGDCSAEKTQNVIEVWLRHT